MDPLQALANYLTYFLTLAVLSLVALAGLIGLGYLILLWIKFWHREERSLSFVLLQVALPRDNEIKIDAAEQLFFSLYALRRTGLKSHLQPQEHITFEMVAKKEDIRFYAVVPERLRDLVEKQIHGAYPGAEVREVDEYNVFTKKGKVAFASLRLKSSAYYPIKVYKDLPTDPLSSLTSSLAKMQEEEGAVMQITVSPARGEGRQTGRAYI